METDKKAPSEEHPARRRRPINAGRLFVGLSIILIGAYYLLRNYGVIDFSIDWWRLWPLIIIFIGLSFLSGRFWWSIVAAVLAVLVIVGAIAAVSVENRGIIIDRNTNNETKTEAISIDKDSGAERVDLSVKFGAGKLNLAEGTTKAVGGDLRSSILDLETSSKLEDKTQEITLSGESRARLFGRQTNELSLLLNTDTPYLFRLDSGAMDMNLDFSEINLQELDIDTGASSLDLEMGDKAERAEVSIQAGASSIDITVPESVGVRASVKSGLSSKSLSNFKKINDRTYETDNYDSANKKIFFDFDLGASSLSINRK